jgi:6-phosphogluconate dehydrogenase
MDLEKARIGLVGLAVMGANLALNIADNGFRISVHNRSTDKIDDLIANSGALSENLIGCPTPQDMVQSLQRPRAIIIMVKAGDPVDAVIQQFLPLLDEGDFLIDAGNANFHHTRRRLDEMKGTGIGFIGMGVSGGEEGARHGPAIMVGGTPEQYASISDILEAISAKFKDVPCVDLVGPDGAGHFVKTVHNGIEYADMEMIAEIFGYMRDAQAKSPAEIGKIFEQWDKGVLKSYLVEITGKVLQSVDAETGAAMVDVILDKAGQKGTGRWTVIEALSLGQSASTIEAAVGARSWSTDTAARISGQSILQSGVTGAPGDGLSNDDLEQALLAAKVIAYSQGFSLLTAAGAEFDWNLDLGRVAEIWREGCIIRSAMLDDMASAARQEMPNGHLMFAPAFAERLAASIPALRKFVSSMALGGLPCPALSAALAYYDTMRQARGTTNLIQAQRDFFGAHGFERLDGRSGQHGDWIA